jgi:hypothetical protein
MAVVQQPIGEMRAKEAGPTRDQTAHRSSSSTPSRPAPSTRAESKKQGETERSRPAAS